MPEKVTCPDCGDTAVRVRRFAIERLLFAEAFRCRNCERRVRLFRGGLFRRERRDPDEPPRQT